MRLWLVTIQDKELRGEPDVGMIIVDTNEDDARSLGRTAVCKLAEIGRSRCVASVREIKTGFAYRTSALIRAPDRSSCARPVHRGTG